MDNNNEEVNGKRYRIPRGSKDDGNKFRIKNQSERASILMQFLVLFDRNFKASIRNLVSKESFEDHFILLICRYLFSIAGPNIRSNSRPLVDRPVDRIFIL